MKLRHATLICICALMLCATLHATAQVVNIPDASLRTALAEHLGKEEGAQITREELATLTEFHADDRGIRDLTGLEFAVNLEGIELRHNAISDLAPFASLVALDNIKLRGNNISDISPLAQLVNVEWLGLEENAITDVSPLTRLAKLDGVGLNHNPVSDLAPLSGLVNLERLDLEYCELLDISDLASLRSLEQLRLEGNSISDITPLAGLTRLRSLGLPENLVSDITPIAGLTELDDLNLDSNLISDIAPLAGLVNLHWLHLGHNVISDITPLANLKNLRWIGASENVGFSLAPLAGLNHLESYHSWGTPIYDISGLANLPRLRSIDICGGGISDLTPLAGATGLRELYLVGNEISDVSPLAGLVNLERLNLRSNNIVDMSPLEELAERIPITWTDNPGFNEGAAVHNYNGSPPAGPKIEGPWLWVLVPAPQLDDRDLLAEVTRGAATEVKVATFGATEGKAVGGSKWRAHTLSATGDDNINEMTAALGWGRGHEIYEHVVYGSISLQSPREQTTTMLVGSDDAVKVWLNGELVHQALTGRGADDYQDAFSVALKRGTNVLLVAIDNHGHGEFSGFFGFEAGTEYTVNRPDARIVVQVPPWDVNRDGQVSVLDLIVVGQAFGKSAVLNRHTDVNRDGKINIADLVLIAQHIDEASAAAPSAVAMESGLSPVTVEAWITLARLENDGSVAFQRGVAVLQRLLLAMRPERTVLLPNYPNPFNPETWIPYHLSEPARVTVRLYAVDGTLVRTLDLGHQASGRYDERSRAAYWDGKNALGEPVASGIYFYTLIAGDFTATRKMLIRK